MLIWGLTFRAGVLIWCLSMPYPQHQVLFAKGQLIIWGSDKIAPEQPHSKSQGEKPWSPFLLLGISKSCKGLKDILH